MRSIFGNPSYLRTPSGFLLAKKETKYEKKTTLYLFYISLFKIYRGLGLINFEEPIIDIIRKNELKKPKKKKKKVKFKRKKLPKPKKK